MFLILDRKDELESEVYKEHRLKLNCAEIRYKGEYFYFPKFVLDNNA